MIFFFFFHANQSYCILEFVADSGRYYRYDGKGDLTKEQIDEYDKGKDYKKAAFNNATINRIYGTINH